MSLIALFIAVVALMAALRATQAVSALITTVNKLADVSVMHGTSIHKLADAYLVAIAPSLPPTPEENT